MKNFVYRFPLFFRDDWLFVHTDEILVMQARFTVAVFRDWLHLVKVL